MSLQYRISPAAFLIPNLRTSQGVFATILIALIAFTATDSAFAERFGSRANTYEFTVEIPYSEQQSVSFDGGSKIDTNSDVGFGLGFGYNFSDHLALDVDVNWNSPYYDATIVNADNPPTAPLKSTGQMTNSNWQFNLLYNFLAGAVTPYVSGGLGWSYIDTQIANGPPTNSCWWDPWYGYVCYGYQSTYSSWRFAYNYALGVRWDMTHEVFLRGSIGQKIIDLPNTGDKAFNGARIDIGFSL